jgi:hypothetical protein
MRLAQILPGVALVCLLLLASAPGAAPDPRADGERTLRLVRAWVHGRYNNQAQFDRDLAAEVPDRIMHRLMHQLFVPVPVAVPALAGYLVFQQSSVNGSTDPRTIARVGLLQFLKDPATGQLRQRELNFRNPEPWKNAHLHPEILKNVTIADVNFSASCDFYLDAAPDGHEITGAMKGHDCRLFSPGIAMELTADDAVVIRPDEYWFWGRYVDGNGKVRWGTESTELNRMVRVSGP